MGDKSPKDKQKKKKQHDRHVDEVGRARQNQRDNRAPEGTGGGAPPDAHKKAG